MSYIGNNPTSPAVLSRHYVLDTIVFNGINDTFTLSVDAVPQNIVDPANCIITINGVLQSPEVAYNISGTTIVFTSVPESGSSFSGIILGSSYQTNIPIEGSIGEAQLQFGSVNLAGDKVTGVLPIANGGTGSSSNTIVTSVNGASGAITNPRAGSLKSATTDIDVMASAAPTAGQVLTASSSTTASWQTPFVATDAKWTAITSTGTYTVPANISSIRCYALGAGGNGGAYTGNLNGNGGGGGGGGGMAYGDIAVTAGQSVTVTISAGVSTVTIGGTTYLTANPGGSGGSGAIPVAGGTAGTASKHASVTSGGAYSGASGAGFNTSDVYGCSGGSSGSPLGAGRAGASAAGGAGWGAAATIGERAGAGTGGAGGGGQGGGAGGAASASYRSPGVGRDITNAYTDPLLVHCTSPGGVGSSYISGTFMPPGHAGPGGGGGELSGNTSGRAGNGGFGGGGGGAGYSSVTAFGGNGGFGGGGGSAQCPSTAGVGVGGNGGNGGGGGGATGGTSATGGTGGAAIVLIYA